MQQQQFNSNTTTDTNKANISLIVKKPPVNNLKKVSFSDSVQDSSPAKSNNQHENLNDTVPKSEEEDLNDFTFKGAFMSSDDGAWMTGIDDLDEDASIHDEPLPPPSLIHSNSEVTE